MKRKDGICGQLWRMPAVVLFFAASLGIWGCVEPFRGSNIQVTFAPGVPALPEPGTVPAPGAPPANTFLSFYAVEFTFARDGSGDIVRDGMGRPVVTDSATFRVVDFEIRPLVDLSSPCFIEVDNSRFPGLHVTKFLEKLGSETGIADPLDPPPDAAMGDVVDMLTAQRRILVNLPAIAATVKAVTSVRRVPPPELGTTCAMEGGDTDGDPALIPPIACTDEASNEVRLARCQAFWDDNQDYFEGNDKVFTIPLNGDLHGTVSGFNPINMGLIGGAGFFVDTVLTGLDSLLINWQFKDLDGDGEPDYPDGAEQSDIGFLFMQGLPRRRTRGVINVPLTHPTESSINGEAAIFPDLGEDRVNF